MSKLIRSQRLEVRITESDKNRITKYCKAMGISTADLITRWIGTLPTEDELSNMYVQTKTKNNKRLGKNEDIEDEGSSG